MKLFIISTFVLFTICSMSIKMDFRVKYRLNYKPDSTDINRILSANLSLFIKNNDFSVCASDNFLKADSISLLLQKGVLTDNDIIANPKNRFNTRFSQFVNKSYPTNNSRIYETVGAFPYAYTLENNLKWLITAEQDTIMGYPCTKATTYYAGRNYEAWFTSEIPISDGPYIFRGLPGLIIKIADTRKHYIFTLTSFQKSNKEIEKTPVFRKQQPIETNRNKIFAMREEYRKDGLEYVGRTLGHSFENATMTRNGVTTPAKVAAPNRSWDNNPLELK